MQGLLHCIGHHVTILGWLPRSKKHHRHQLFVRMTSQIPVRKGRLPKKPRSLAQQLQIHGNQGPYTNPGDRQKLLCTCYKHPPGGALVSKATFYRHHDEVTAASKRIGWSFKTPADFLQVEQDDKCRKGDQEPRRSSKRLHRNESSEEDNDTPYETEEAQQRPKDWPTSTLPHTYWYLHEEFTSS